MIAVVAENGFHWSRGTLLLLLGLFLCVCVCDGWMEVMNDEKGFCLFFGRCEQLFVVRCCCCFSFKKSECEDKVVMKMVW